MGQCRRSGVCEIKNNTPHNDGRVSVFSPYGGTSKTFVNRNRIGLLNSDLISGFITGSISTEWSGASYLSTGILFCLFLEKTK